MAQLTNMPRGAFPPVQIYDVTKPVGWGLTNGVEDVQLVQFAINKLAPKMGIVDPRKMVANHGAGLSVYAPLAPLTLDGRLGPETANAIKCYKSSAGGAQDNTVDPCYVLFPHLSGDPTGPGYIKAYVLIYSRTIYRMNSDHLRLYGRIMNDDEFPLRLKMQVRRAPQRG